MHPLARQREVGDRERVVGVELPRLLERLLGVAEIVRVAEHDAVGRQHARRLGKLLQQRFEQVERIVDPAQFAERQRPHRRPFHAILGVENRLGKGIERLQRRFKFAGVQLAGRLVEEFIEMFVIHQPDVPQTGPPPLPRRGRGATVVSSISKTRPQAAGTAVAPTPPSGGSIV